jgi:hypothetical protein
MKTSLRTFTFTLLALLCLGRVEADERVVVESKDISIIVDDLRLSTAERLQRIFPETKEEVENLLSWKLLSKPVVILVGDKKTFESMSGSPYVSAYAVPERHIIVMSLSPGGSEPYFFNATFKHELCHLVLHDHVKDTLLPRWLDEGVCQWVSGSLGEILLGDGTSAATRIDIVRNPIPLNRLALGFPADKRSLSLAYEESRSFVDYISARYGPETLLSILNHLRDGDAVDQAVAKSLSKPFDTLEKEWLESIRSSNLWLIWISQYLYEILFAAAALLTVVAFIRLRFRKRRYIEEEDDAEDTGDRGET